MYKVPSMPNTPDIKLGSGGTPLDGGINLQFQETALQLNQSPYLLNLNADDRGTLVTRWGQANLDTSLGTGGINGVIIYKGKIIKAWGTGLYSEDLSGNNCTQIYSSLTNSKAFLFVFNGLLYLLNGHEFIQYDGTTVKNVVPYISTISQGRKPDGSQSTLYEPLNLLGGTYNDSFSSDGTTTYVLSYQGLDSIDEVKVNNEVVTTGFTKDLTNGKVIFTNPIAESVPNNVIIKWTKNSLKDADKILKCTRGKEFSSRMFLTGNTDFPNKLWKTGLTDAMEANYFPATGLSSFDVVGGIDQAMVNFVQQYDKFVYLKEKSCYITYAQTQTDGSVGFPINPLNPSIGCDMPDSIQIIDNNPVWANSRGGVYMMMSTTVLGEKNIIHISQNVDGTVDRPGLLEEAKSDLLKAASFDDGKKYYLCVGKKVYVWDYSLGYDINNPETLHWFIYDNVNASQFFSIDNTMCYADRDNGVLSKFVNVSNDFGSAINSIWRSKLMDFDAPEWYKNVTQLLITTRANSNSSITINYYSDTGAVVDSTTISKDSINSFDWDNWDWDNFTWDYQLFPPTIPLKPPIKGIRYFQLELTNNTANENLSIINILIKYALTKRVK